MEPRLARRNPRKEHAEEVEPEERGQLDTDTSGISLHERSRGPTEAAGANTNTDGGGAEAPGGAANRGGNPDEGPGSEAKPEAAEAEPSGAVPTGADAGSDTEKGRKRGHGGSGATGAATGTARRALTTGAGGRKPKEPHEGTEEGGAKEGARG